MATANPDFDAGAFRSAIQFVFTMAEAPQSGDQLAFYGPSTLVYTTPLDDADVPFDPASTVVRQQAAPVHVPCGVEYFDTQGQPIVFGMVTPSRLAVTLLDEDYALVKDATYVVAGGDRYNFRRTEPPTGLFDVGLFRMHFSAENET